MSTEECKASAAMASLWQTAGALQQDVAANSEGLEAQEGQRFLLRMLAASVDTYVEHGDHERPIFHFAESSTRKMFADCPDADYLRAPIKLGEGRVYRLWGRVPPDALYVGFVLYGRGGRIGNKLTDRDLNLDSGGHFEIFISTDQQEGTWLRGDSDETAVMVRQYFTDRRDQTAVDVKIELLGKPQLPVPLDEERIPSQLSRAERMLKAIYKRTVQTYRLASVAAVNTFIQEAGEQLFPTPDNSYSAALYRMGPDKKILIRGRLPRARYFSVTLYNSWLESLDYQRHVISLNHEQLQLREDGSFEVCLADQKPEHANWLDIAGHREGYIIARALLLEGEMPELDLEVLPARNPDG